MTSTVVASLTPDEARRLLPEAAAAVLSGGSLIDALTHSGLLPPVCDFQCRLGWDCGHAEHERLSEWLAGCVVGAANEPGTAAMRALTECHEILRIEETKDA